MFMSGFEGLIFLYLYHKNILIVGDYIHTSKTSTVFQSLNEMCIRMTLEQVNFT